MSNVNPIVRDTAQNTQNEAINALQLLITALSLDTPDDNNNSCYSGAEIAGLCNQLRSIQDALETGFAQQVTAQTNPQSRAA
jgi:hypothetical protein